MIVVSRRYVALRHITFVTLRNIILYYVASFDLGLFCFVLFLLLACFFVCFTFCFGFIFVKKITMKMKINHVTHML